MRGADSFATNVEMEISRSTFVLHLMGSSEGRSEDKIELLVEVNLRASASTRRKVFSFAAGVSGGDLQEFFSKENKKVRQLRKTKKAKKQAEKKKKRKEKKGEKKKRKHFNLIIKKINIYIC